MLSKVKPSTDAARCSKAMPSMDAARCSKYNLHLVSPLKISNYVYLHLGTDHDLHHLDNLDPNLLV